MELNERQLPEPDLQPVSEEELRRTELAIRQLERAELYVVAAINLELSNLEHRRALHQLHGELLAVHELLRKPHMIR
jgi:hypothetical protein